MSYEKCIEKNTCNRRMCPECDDCSRPNAQFIKVKEGQRENDAE